MCGGGGIRCENSDASLSYNQIYDNTAVYYGAGVQAYNCTPSLINNTITQNRCTSTSTTAKGGGVYAYSGSSCSGRNNIVYDNAATTNPEVFGTVNFSYSSCSIALAGTGNITDDPEFFDPEEDNFYLLAYSPCIDTGDPSSPLDPDGTRADMGALFFDQSTGAMFVPNVPTDFTIAHNNTALIASLSWINPTLQANLDPLTELLGIKIYRQGAMIANVTDVVIGQPYNYDDNTVPSIGMYEYGVVPYNSYGDGYPAEASAWIGLDAPGLPNDVLATPDPTHILECTITWSSPTEGQHGGYWPPSSWTGQKVYREGMEIADLPGTNTSYLDDAVPHAGFYTYGVSYYNSSGEGPIGNAFPDPVFVGPPQFEQVPFDWVEINPSIPGALPGINTGITGDDQNLGPFNIGFGFPFYDNATFSSIRVCSNGWASFTSTSTAYSNLPIPTSGEPNNLVAPYWDDLYPPGGGSIWYYSDAANDRFIIEFFRVPHITGGGRYSFEIILYTNGDIDYMYAELTPGTANSATVGIENANGSDGIQVTYNGSGPLEPQAQMGIRVYSVATGIPEMALTLTPYGTPIQIPAGGGSFNFDIQIENLEPGPVTCDVWTEAILPSGNPVQILLRTGIAFAGGAVIQRNLTQSIPATAPPGNYTYHGCAGSHPNTIFAEDSFPFEKLGTGDGTVPPGRDGWTLTGWDVEDGLALEIPTEYALQPAYPNPFNPVTTISFALPEAGRVTLTVYDISGRQVATVVNGWRDAGYHQVSFDAANLSSGVYIYRISAGDFSACHKMILMK